MSTLLDDLDYLMMPHRCVYTNAHTNEGWQEIYNWLDANCGRHKWYIGDGSQFWFTKEEHLILFILRWS